jgi:NDP-sugar pyrophosphorylase family protein
MPIGGLGKRFSVEGYKVPKPLIEVDGMPMYRQSFSSFDGVKEHASFFAVVRAEHEENFGLASSLESEGVVVKVFEGNTRGPTETALIGLDMLDSYSPLVVVDCDIRFRSPELLEDLLRDPPPFSGAVTHFQSRDNRYSFAEIDSSGLVTRTAEKDSISGHALIGCYAFSTAAKFAEAANQQLEEGLTISSPEYYISTVFNSLIEKGEIVKAYRGYVDSFGTPEELESFLARR